VNEDILERKRKLGRADFGDGRRKFIIFGGIHRDGRNRLLLRRGEGEEVRCDPIEITHVDSLEFLISAITVRMEKSKQQEFDNILFKVEVAKATQTLLFGFPHTINDILNVQDEVRLAVPRIAEGHVRRIGLRDRRKGEVGWPGLNQDHVACHNAGSICAATGIGLAVENNRAVAVGRISQDLVEKHSEAVEMADVQRTEVGMECVVEKGVVNSEVDRGSTLGSRCSWLGPALARRLGSV
jgi:hypothetical protein